MFHLTGLPTLTLTPFQSMLQYVLEWVHNANLITSPLLDQRSSMIFLNHFWEKDHRSYMGWHLVWSGLQSWVSHTHILLPMSSHTGLLLVHLFRKTSKSHPFFLEHFSFYSLSSYLIIIHPLALTGLFSGKSSLIPSSLSLTILILQSTYLNISLFTQLCSYLTHVHLPIWHSAT